MTQACCSSHYQTVTSDTRSISSAMVSALKVDGSNPAKETLVTQTVKMVKEMTTAVKLVLRDKRRQVWCSVLHGQKKCGK